MRTLAEVKGDLLHEIELEVLESGRRLFVGQKALWMLVLRADEGRRLPGVLYPRARFADSLGSVELSRLDLLRYP